MIHVGDLRHLATFSLPTEMTEDGDTTLDPFVESFDAWVSIQPLAGSEGIVADQMQASQVSLVTVRHNRRIHPRMRMTARNRTFEILSVLNVDERDIEMQLTCRELV